MKKPYLFAVIAGLLIVALGVIFFVSGSPDDGKVQETLAQQQEITQSETSEETSQRAYISPKKQQQLDQITAVYSDQERAYRESVTKIMQKYNSSFTQSDTQQVLTLIESSASEELLASSIKTTFNIGLLKADIQKMMTGRADLLEEKDLKQSRLESFMERNNSEIDTNTQTLMQLSMSESLRQNSRISSREISTISRKVAGELFKPDSYILSQGSYDLQIAMLQEQLSLALETVDGLSGVEKLRLIKHVRDDITNLDILLTPQEIDQIEEIQDESTSFLPLRQGLKYLSSFIFPQAFADEPVTLTPQERQILILKTQIFIDRILRESIQAEIEYNADNLTQIQYENIIEDNLIELEELVILKESLENDPSAISLGDIQRFNLGAYTDDSEIIQDLPLLAYIQSKSGHVVIHNLNGSARLGEENMSLYSGYKITTLGNSSVSLVFSDESILRLDELSEVTISNLNGGDINVAVEQGSLWARVLKPLLSGDILTIDVDGVSLGVRGTSLFVSKQTSGSIAQIVDSYTADGSASVQLTDATGSSSEIMPGTQISIDSAANASVSDKSRESLLSENPDIGDYIKEDISYLSLLINDRQRGFYNTPNITQNDGKNFIDKLIGELEVSIPNTAEKSYIIKNSQLHSQLVSTGSIYHLIKKDEMISAIKQNPNGNTNSKINAVVDLNMQDLENTLGNQRAIENLFNYNILKDITDRTSLTSQELRDIFINFPLQQVQDAAGLLAKAKQELTVNGGSSIVTGDITLSPGIGNVSIRWKSLETDIISDTGRAGPRDDEQSTILTATLSIGNLTTTKDFALTVVPRQASPLEELQAAALVLDEHFQIFTRFTDEIIIQNNQGLSDNPDFSARSVITPIIKFNGSKYINTNGSTNRPAYLDSLFGVYTAADITATLQHPTFTNITTTRSYRVEVKRKDITSAELLIQAQQNGNQLLDTAVQILERHYLPSTRDIRDTLTHSNLPAGVDLEWELGGNYIDSTGAVTRPNYNKGDEQITVNAKLTHPNVQNPRYVSNINLNILKQLCSGNIIGSDCYQLVAAAEYNTNYNLGNLSPLDTTNLPPLLTENGEKGIKPLSTNSHALSYDLSSLNLGDDWAIEMSVRGQDLKRDDTKVGGGSRNYGLISIPGELYVFNRKGSFEINDKKGLKPPYSSSITNGYKNIIITSNELYFGSSEYNLSNLNLSDSFFVGSFHDKTQQWNGIINNLKVYKKSR